MFKLYRCERAEVLDAWSKPVEVQKLVEVVDVEVVGKREYDNGYEKIMIDVASDGNRTFYRPIEVDYWGGGTWFEDNAPEGYRPWHRASRLGNDRFVDAIGNPFSKAKLIEEFGE
jgi:hypothetical protein